MKKSVRKESAETVYDSLGTTVAAPAKKKMRADVFLLLFIVFIALATMVTLTVMKFDGDVLSGDAAYAETENNEFSVVSTLRSDESGRTSYLSDTSLAEDVTWDNGSGTFLDADGNPVVDDGTDYGQEEYFDTVRYMESSSYDYEEQMVVYKCYVHDDTGILLDENGQPSYYYKKYHGQPESAVEVKINMDEVFGLTEDSTTETLVENARNACPVTIAYAGNTDFGNYDSSVRNYANEYRIGAYSASCSYTNYNADANTSCYIKVTMYGATWRNWIARGVAQCYSYYSCNNTSWNSLWQRHEWSSGGGVPAANNGGTWSWYTAPTWCYSYWMAWYCRTNRKSCSNCTASINVYSAYFTFRHLDGNGISCTTPSFGSWARYRDTNAISITYYQSVSRIYYVWMRVYNGYYNNDSAYGDNAISGNTNSTSLTLKNGRQCWSRLYHYGRSWNNAFTNGSWSTWVNADQLKIDNIAPSGSNVRLNNSTSQYSNNIQTGSNTDAGGYYIGSQTSTVYLFVYVVDNAYNCNNGIRGCGASGVSWVTARNDGNGWQSGMSHIGSNWYRVGLQAQYANGPWRITCGDNAGNSTTITSYWWVSAVDCQSPVYDNNVTSTIESGNSVVADYYTAGNAASASWTNTPFYTTFSMWDASGATYYPSAYRKRAGLARLDVWFTYNGKTYCMSTGTASGANYNISNYISWWYTDGGNGPGSYVGWANTFYQRFRCAYWMPYGSNVISSYQAKIYDYVGHCTTVNLNTSNIRVDTIAPQITAISNPSAGTNNASFTSGNPTITVTVQDYTADASGYYSNGGKYNNGSGVYAVYAYFTNNTKGGSVIYSKTSVQSCGLTSAVNVTFTIDRDAYNIAGGVGSDPNVYFVAVDWCGNRSDSTNGNRHDSSTTRSTKQTHYKANYKAINGYTWGSVDGYYYSLRQQPGRAVYRDTVQPQVYVYNMSNQLIASSNSSSGTTPNYTFPWVSAGQLQFKIKCVYGSGSGNLRETTTGSTISNRAYYRNWGSAAVYNSAHASTSPAYRESELITLTANVQGTKTYTYVYNGTKSSTAVNITTRLDNGAPSVSLMGFSSSERNSNTIGSAWNDTESNLTNNWTAKSYYAVFKVTDTLSGVSQAANHTQAYGVNGTASSQTTQSKYQFTFTYSNNNGRTYTKTDTGYMKYIGNAYYVQVKVFDPTQYQSLTSNGVSFYNKSTGRYDISTGTYLHYKFRAWDFIGNSNYCYTSYGLGTKSGGVTNDLVYKADPFNVSCTVNMYSMAAGNWSTSVTKKALTGTSVYRNDWTKDYVVGQIIVYPGLSPTSPKWGYRDLSDGKTTQSSSASAFTFNNPAASGGSFEPQGGSSAMTTNGGYPEYWLYFTATTKNIQIAVQVASATHTGTSLGAANNSNANIIIKQDTTKPTLISAFLSSSAGLTAVNSTDSTIYLYYDAAKDASENYTYTLNTTVSQKEDISKLFTWSDRKLYLYTVVTDTVYASGTGKEGSGLSNTSLAKVGSVVVTGTGVNDTMNPVAKLSALPNTSGGALDNVGTRNYYLYKTSITNANSLYGYTTKQMATTYSIKLTDKIGNASEAKNFGAKNAKANGSAYKVFPVVDAVNPYIALTNTASITYKSMDNGKVGNATTGSYTYSSGNTDMKGAGVNKLRGTDSAGKEYFTSSSTVTLNLSYAAGISGDTVYIRKRDFNKSLAAETGYTQLTQYGGGGNYLPSGYNLGAQGWTAITTHTPADSASGEQTGSVQKALTSTSLKNRYDVLIVNGTGRYYLIEMGDVYIDSEAPIIQKNATFFTMVRDVADATNGVVDYNAVTKIWSHTVGSEYTNGPVNIYYCVTDAATGVNSATVKTTDSKAMSQVTVNNVRVYAIKYNGTSYPTYIRERSGSTVVMAGQSGKGKCQIKVGTETIETHIDYNSSLTYTVETVSTSMTYYSYQIGTSTAVKIQAEDNAGNKTTTTSDTNYSANNAISYTPKIEVDDTTMTLNVDDLNDNPNNKDHKASGIVKSYDYEDTANFTQNSLNVEVKVGYGVSGLGKITVKKTNQSPLLTSNNATYNITVPTVSNSGGKVRIAYTDKDGKAQTSTSTVAYPSTGKITLALKASSSNYVWVINGTTTTYTAYKEDNYYAGIVDLNATLTVDIPNNLTTMTFKKSYSNVNCQDEYVFTATNGVTLKSAKTEVEGAIGKHVPSKTTASKTGYLSMDTTAPTFDTTKGNYSALSATDKWHIDPKVLSIKITDNLSGVGKDSRGLIDNVYMTWEYYTKNSAGNSVKNSGKAYLINDFADGLYRPVDYTYSDKTGAYSFTKLIACEYCVTYTVTVVDKAGNSRSITFKPKIDTFAANVVGDISAKTDKTVYNLTTKQTSTVTYEFGTWTNGKVELEMDLEYGMSGYVLQYRTADNSGALTNQWSNITDTNFSTNNLTNTDKLKATYKLVSGGGVSTNTNSPLSTAKVRLTFAADSSVTAYYKYLQVRVLSHAEYEELRLSSNSAGDCTVTEGDILVGTNKVANFSVGQTNLLSIYGDTLKVDANNALVTTAGTKTVVADGKSSSVSAQLYTVVNTAVTTAHIMDATHKPGQIQIDKVTPTVSVQANSSTVAYGKSLGTNSWQCGDKDGNTLWVNNNVALNVTATQTATGVSGLNFASGNMIYYTTDATAALTDWTKWNCLKAEDGMVYQVTSETGLTGATKPGGLNATPKKQSITGLNYLDSFINTITDKAVNNRTYRFYVKTGAGLRSDIFTVSNINIDQSVPVLTTDSRTTYDKFDTVSDKYQSVAKSVYDAQSGIAYAYSIEPSTVYTSKNSVIIRYIIGTVGLSGVQLTIVDSKAGITMTDEIEYQTAAGEYTTKNSGVKYYYDGTNYNVYYAVAKNGETLLAATVISNAVNNKDYTHNKTPTDTGYVRIDNTTPVIYVKSVTGLKANNWEYEKARYDAKKTAESDTWYIGTVTIKLGVGVLENIGTVASPNYVFKDVAPYSGFSVYYNEEYTDIKNELHTYDGWESTVSTIGENETTYLLEVDGTIPKKLNTYTFKITSNTGMTYELGGKAVNNQDKDISSIGYSSQTYSNINLFLKNGLKSVIGHTVSGMEDETSVKNIEYKYTINIDTNVYDYSYTEKLLTNINVGESVYQETQTLFADYDIFMATWDKTNGAQYDESAPIDYDEMPTFRHGDQIMVKYASKTSGTYPYYHDYAEINNGETTYYGRYLSADEASGKFTGQFTFSDIDMVSYFGAELTVTYTKDVHYLQYKAENDPLKTTGSVSYKAGGMANAVSPTLDYKYYRILMTNGARTGETVIDNTQAVGAYEVAPSISLYNAVKVDVSQPVTKDTYYTLVDARYRIYDGSTFMVDTKYYTRSFVKASVTPADSVSGGTYYVYENEKYKKFSGSAFVAGTDYYVEQFVLASVTTADTVTKDAYYVFEEAHYELYNESAFALGTTYYVRNDNGNFRVRIIDTAAEEERKLFVVKYFNEDTSNSQVESGYYKVDNYTDLQQIGSVYYILVDEEPVEKKYTEFTNGNVYKLTEDILLPTDFGGIPGTMKIDFEGGNKTLTMQKTDIVASYGVFTTLSATVQDLNIRVKDKLNVVLAQEANVGLLASVLDKATVMNVSVIADVNILTTADASFGGIAGKAVNSTVGGTDKPVYTDIRLTNNGKNIASGSAIGGIIGTASNVAFVDAIAFGEMTVYGVPGFKNVGIAVGNGTIGTVTSLRYFADNTFINDATESDIGGNYTAIGTALKYDAFVEESAENYLGNISVAGGNSVATLIVTRLYADFGLKLEDKDELGNGSVAQPLHIGTVAHIQTIDKYMNLNYRLTEEEIDMATYQPTVAIHKVFNGCLDGSDGSDASTYTLLTHFADNVNTVDNNLFGLFGQLNGTVKNLVFTDVDIDVTYTGSGSETFYAGMIAGTSGAKADVNNVFMVGFFKVGGENVANVYAGGIVGATNGGSITDVMSVNNLSVTADNIKAGGIVGVVSNATKLAETGSIYALGRVEATKLTKNSDDAQTVAGAIIGEGVAASATASVYGIRNNTYNNGNALTEQSIGNGSMSTGRIYMVEFNNEDMRNNTKLSNGKSAFTLLYNGWYPLKGAGLSSDKFKIESKEDFKNINLALYATYSITKDIAFDDGEFETIGYGLNFTGSLDGSKTTGGVPSVESGQSNISLSNVTGPLVYNIVSPGSVQNMAININYTGVATAEEEFYFGAVAIKSSGDITNITVSGTVDIVGSDDMTSTAFVSGFIAESFGGNVNNSSLQNAISALTINVSNIGTLYVGGYAASVQEGEATFSFGISNGNIHVKNCNNVICGLLVGEIYSGTCSWNLAQLSTDYLYNITVDGVAVQKVDETAITAENPNGAINLVGNYHD